MKSGSTSTPMTAAEREATRRRLQIWQEAQPLLEEQRWRELMALTEEEALKRPIWFQGGHIWRRVTEQHR